ncbi:MAG: sodium:solute symporter family protein [Methanocalculaceae archaeon]|jgi:SSS family solute:Na+ symporter|nr:sodium:solute symporter family protein [Methanocalculaceae archaeon]
MIWTVDTWIALFLIVIYFALLLGIGIWAAKKIKNSEDYILAGRSLGFWIFVLLLITSICSGVTLIGGSGMGFIYGWPSIWDQIFVPLSAVFCIVFFGSKLNLIGKKQGIITLEDYFSLRYENDRELRTLSAIIGILVSLVYLVGQYTAISIVLVWLFEMEHWQALLIATVIITTYTVLGGLHAVSWTSMMQGLILIFGMIIFAPMIVTYAGGFEHINIVLAAIDPNLVMPAFPEKYAEYAYITPEIIFSFGILLVVGLACAPHVVSNVLAVKDVRFFRWAPLIVFVIYLIISMLVRFSGMGVRTLVEVGNVVLPDVINSVDYSFVYGISASVGGVGAMGLFAVMILAAVMSTTDRLMLTIGTLFSWNIFKMILCPKATEAQIIRVSRITMFVAVIISLLLAVNPPEILVFLIFLAIGLILASFAIPLIAGMYWRRATTEGAITSMGVGLVTALCFGYYDRFMGQLPMHFSMYALIFSITAMVIASILTKKNSDAALDITYTGWYLHPKE